MSRLQQRFEALRGAGRRALIPYITAGDPHPRESVPLLHAMVEAGADILEFGVPFSDPMADGPVIQAACERALEHKVGLDDVLDLVAEFRKTDSDTPVVLMGYLNPVEAMGYAAFAERAARAGVDGLLTVDLPPEESHALIQQLKQQAIDPIFLIAPTTNVERIGRISAVASGFVYYVSLKGVTGASSLDVDSVTAKLSEIRGVTALPVGVGFGIRDATSAAAVAAVADAVVVGSSVVRQIEAHRDGGEPLRQAVIETLRPMREAIDAVQNLRNTIPK